MMAIISFSSFLSLDDYYTNNQKEFFNNAGVIVDKIHTDFYNELRFVTDKYKDNLTLVDVENGTSRTDFFKELIAEKEYKEIINIINLNTQDIGVIYAYLKIFEFLRGTKAGVNTVFNLLGYKDLNNVPNSPKGFLIKEWWEYETKKERMTYDLTLVMPLESYSSYFIQNIRRFLSFYVYPLLKTLLVTIPINFAELNQGIGIFKDKIITTENYNNSLYASMNIYKDKTIIFISNPPPLPLGVQWNHNFDLLNPLADSSTYNNNLIEQKGLSSNTWLFYHNFDLLNPLTDLSGKNNNLIERKEILNPPIYNHNFDLANPLIDSTVNANNLVERVSDPTIGYNPPPLSLANGFIDMIEKFAIISGNFGNDIIAHSGLFTFTYEITNINPAGGFVATHTYTIPIGFGIYDPEWASSILENGIQVTGILDVGGVFLAIYPSGNYWTRYKIGNSNWSNIQPFTITQLAPPPIF